ncbi:MAG: ABC transporter ATP-binding protein [Pseudonocardiaceae bacterium]
MRNQPERPGALLFLALRSAWVPTATAALAGLLGAVSALLLPTALATAVDAAIKNEPVTVLSLPVVLLAIVLLAQLAASVLEQIADVSGVARTTAWLRTRVAAGLFARGLAGQREVPAGDATARLTGVSAAAGGLPAMLIGLVTSTLITVVALVFLTLIDWWLVVTLLLATPVVYLLLRVLTREIFDATADYQQAQAGIAGRMVDALAGRRTIRAAGTLDREVDRVLADLPALRAAGAQFWTVQRKVAWSFSLLAPVVQVIVLATAGWGLTQGRISAPELVAVLGYVALVMGGLNDIDTVLEISGCHAAAARIADVTVRQVRGRHRKDHQGDWQCRTGLLPAGHGEVHLRDVTVTLGGKTVLDRLDLTIPGGTTMALVGSSGAGKSVLVGLLGGLYRPDRGLVLIDRSPVDALTEVGLRSAVAYAFERPVLLGATLGEAIGYGCPEPDADAVLSAARVAQADGFVRRLPEGYATPVAQAPLSGGELQRLGLARAVVQNARVTVLDDATGSLDTATEAQVQEALSQVMAGRTRIMVTQRVATAAAADAVAWLQGGRIRALRPHAELWSDPDYRALFAGTS